MNNATTGEWTQASRDRAIERAVTRALEQSRAGNLPTLLRAYVDPAQTCQVWSIGSRTTGGTVYLIDLEANSDGITTHCSCQAGDADRICWHRAAVRLACLGEISHHEARQPVRRLTSADLMGGPR